MAVSKTASSDECSEARWLTAASGVVAAAAAAGWPATVLWPETGLEGSVGVGEGIAEAMVDILRAGFLVLE